MSKRMFFDTLHFARRLRNYEHTTQKLMLNTFRIAYTTGWQQSRICLVEDMNRTPIKLS